jgi:transcriptional regulator with XRE-family HTH domain
VGVLTIEVIFGKALRKLREQMKISQEELAFRSTLDRSYISLLERGRRKPTINTLFALAEQLNVSPTEMVRQVELEWKKKR